MAEWKKIITSGSIAELAQITASTGISATSIKDVTTFEAGGDLDIGAHEFRAETFESDVSTGTAPFTVASTTAVSNLNADLLDGQHGSHYLDFGNFVIDDSEIPLDKLAQDAITIAGTSTQLGGSITAAAILNNGKAIVSGSLGDNATLIRSLTAVKISGSFTEDSASFSTRITAAEANDGDITRVNITAGNGLGGTQDTTEGEHTQTLSVNAAQTTITSVKNDSLIIGRSAADDLITFTNGDIALGIGGTERLGIDANGIQVTGDAVISGDLTVNGDLTTIATTNTLVEDQLMFLGTGSAGTNKDVGIIAQSGSTDKQGSALYHDTNSERWSVAKSVNNNATAITPLQHIVTVTTSTSTPGAANADYGVGEMWVDTDASEPTGNGVIYIRTA